MNRFRPRRGDSLSVAVYALCLLAIELSSLRQLEAASYSVQYQYDDLNRLETATYGSGDANVYRYDEVGNLELLSLKLDCVGDDLLIADTTYLSGQNKVCIGFHSIDAASNVSVNSGASVTYEAPAVRIGPGFNVSRGGIFSVRSN